MEKKRRPRIIKPNSVFSTERFKEDPPPPEEQSKQEDSGDTKNNEEREKPSLPPPPPPSPDRSQRPQDSDRPQRPYDPDRQQRPYERREGGGGGGNYGERKPWQERERRPYDPDRPQRPYDPDRQQRPYERREGGGGYGNRDQRGGGFKKPFGKKPFRKKDEFVVERKPKPGLPSGEGMPLNKYLAHCGVASRRKAVDFIAEGKVTVNGEVKTEPFYRIQAGDAILCDGKDMKIQERQVYILLNKPKGVITTTEDEHGRATVLDIVDPHFPERIYPVGRLDRDTTGLLLITNDGDLAQKLAHPSHQIKKHYRIGLDRPLSHPDFERLEKGIELEDGPAPVNWIRFSEDHPERNVVELEIVIGRNRIVRRMFEFLGYRVRKLDRFYYAGLTKRELPRGGFRELTQREIIMLKHFSGNPPTPVKKDDNSVDPDEDTGQL